MLLGYFSFLFFLLRFHLCIFSGLVGFAEHPKGNSKCSLVSSPTKPQSTQDQLLEDFYSVNNKYKLIKGVLQSKFKSNTSPISGLFRVFVKDKLYRVK